MCVWFWVFFFIFVYLDNDVFIGNDVGYELRKLVADEYTVGVCLFDGRIERTKPISKKINKKKSQQNYKN